EASILSVTAPGRIWRCWHPTSERRSRRTSPSTRRSGRSCKARRRPNRMVLATNVVVNEDNLPVELADGRTIAAPLAWYPRLSQPTVEERNSWRLIADGRDIHWPESGQILEIQTLET